MTQVAAEADHGPDHQVNILWITEIAAQTLILPHDYRIEGQDFHCDGGLPQDVHYNEEMAVIAGTCICGGSTSFQEVAKPYSGKYWLEPHPPTTSLT